MWYIILCKNEKRICLPKKARGGGGSSPLPVATCLACLKSFLKIFLYKFSRCKCRINIACVKTRSRIIGESNTPTHPHIVTSVELHQYPPQLGLQYRCHSTNQNLVPYIIQKWFFFLARLNFYFSLYSVLEVFVPLRRIFHMYFVR